MGEHAPLGGAHVAMIEIEGDAEALHRAGGLAANLQPLRVHAVDVGSGTSGVLPVSTSIEPSL